jgi:hypothetical protein
MVKVKASPYRVPVLWPNGGTAVVLGSGPSLSAADVDYVRERVDGVIAVNDTYRLAPWATALYAADAKWWQWHKGAPSFTGQFKFTLSGTATTWPGVVCLKRGQDTGLSENPEALALGRNGVYQAINLAVHFGATRILLLGVDMQNGARADGRGTSDHFFGHHPDNTGPQFSLCLERFKTLVAPLAARGVEVINCSRRTALRCFPMKALEDVFRVGCGCPKGHPGTEGPPGENYVTVSV